MNYSLDQIKAVIAKKGYVFFDSKVPFNLNFIGVRKTINSVVDTFEDDLYMAYYDQNLNFLVKRYNFTTKPGLCILQHPINADGAFILVPGQYRHAFKLGLHHGTYECLVQAIALPGYRDNNKDGKFDYDPATIVPGSVNDGIHCHHGSVFHTDYPVGPYSAGCQVVEIFNEYQNEVLPTWKESLTLSDALTYTLLEDKDFLI